MQALRETFRTELWTGTAMGFLYAWLIQNKKDVSPAIWYIGPVVAFFCGVRCFALYFHMRQISKYLIKIEKESFGNNTELPGWERFFNTSLRIPSLITGIVIWILMFVTTIVGSLILSR